MPDTLEQFIALVEQKNMFHRNYLKRNTEDITIDEIAAFDSLIAFYAAHFNCSLENLVDKYLKLVEFFFEEQMYFTKNNRYRFSTFAEVEHFYKNTEYMDCYTIGLGLSTYLWKTHRNVLRFFNILDKEDVNCISEIIQERDKFSLGRTEI